MTKKFIHAQRGGRSGTSRVSAAPALSGRPLRVSWNASQVYTGGVRLPVVAGQPITAAPASGWVIVVHQSGSPAGQPRPAAEAALLELLHRAGLATLSVDLLTSPEAAATGAGFRTAQLGARLAAVTRWLAAQPAGRGRRVGYLAAGQASAAALWAAAELRTEVAGVVSLGGRVDLAARRLPEIVAPVMLVVNRRDRLVLGVNQAAHQHLNPASRLVVAPSFRYLRYWLADPAALDRLLAREWLAEHVLRQPLAPERPRLTDWLPNLNLRGKAIAAATVLALLASLAGPAQPAEAAGSVSVSSGTLTFSDDSGGANNLTVEFYIVPWFLGILEGRLHAQRQWPNHDRRRRLPAGQCQFGPVCRLRLSVIGIH